MKKTVGTFHPLASIVNPPNFDSQTGCSHIFSASVILGGNEVC
jgi:hypothetical protein